MVGVHQAEQQRHQGHIDEEASSRKVSRAADGRVAVGSLGLIPMQHVEVVQRVRVMLRIHARVYVLPQILCQPPERQARSAGP